MATLVAKSVMSFMWCVHDRWLWLDPVDLGGCECEIMWLVGDGDPMCTPLRMICSTCQLSTYAALHRSATGRRSWYRKTHYKLMTYSIISVILRLDGDPGRQELAFFYVLCA